MSLLKRAWYFVLDCVGVDRPSHLKPLDPEKAAFLKYTKPDETKLKELK